MNLSRLTEIAHAFKGRAITGGRNFHIAFILNKSKIISIGVNNYLKTHPAISKLGYPVFSGIHAELSACIKLGLTNCAGYDMVVMRIDNENKVNLSKPCKSCARMLAGLNFNSIVFSNESGKFEKVS